MTEMSGITGLGNHSIACTHCRISISWWVILFRQYASCQIWCAEMVWLVW